MKISHTNQKSLGKVKRRYHMSTTPQSPRWHTSWLSNACATRKDPEPEWLASENLETKTITIKPETVSHMAEQSSWIPLPSCSLLGHPLPNELSYFVRMCASLDNSFLSARQEPSFDPVGVPVPATKLETNKLEKLERTYGLGGNWATHTSKLCVLQRSLVPLNV